LALEKVILSLPARQNMETLGQNTILVYAYDIVIIGSSQIDMEVTDFKYLGININNSKNMHNEIKLRIASGNKGYYALAKLFKSKLLSRKS